MNISIIRFGKTIKSKLYKWNNHKFDKNIKNTSKQWGLYRKKINVTDLKNLWKKEQTLKINRKKKEKIIVKTKITKDLMKTWKIRANNRDYFVEIKKKALYEQNYLWI